MTTVWINFPSGACYSSSDRLVPSAVTAFAIPSSDISAINPVSAVTTASPESITQAVTFFPSAVGKIQQSIAINFKADASLCTALPSVITAIGTQSIPWSSNGSATSLSAAPGGSVAGSAVGLTPNSSIGAANQNPSGTPNHSSNAGPIAGAAVGCLIAGVAIGVAILFLLGFRRRKASTVAHSQPTYVDSEGKSGVTTSSSMSISTNSAAAIVERNLPDPIADGDITSEFSKIDDKINGHVNSFYRQGRTTDHTAAVQAATQLLGGGSSISLQKLTALMSNPQSQPTVLRLVIAKILVSRMDSDSPSTSSLLPFGTAASIRGMPRVQANDATRMAFMTKWRVITAYLMGVPSNSNIVSEESVHQTVLDCDQIVGPYATPSNDQQARLQNLEEICRRAGRVAGMLFSQQAHFQFDWQQSGPGLVVFPGLVKLTDENGRLLQQPIVFTEKKIVQV